ncbi:PPC domain-containing protein [Luteolibacter yonseiensis]|uniref:PPC domain-containing protein n=1 Tax=Luteolibacter yonseiensis TaxID=1144680 RepID=A0A934V9U0_9BACT|nr:PPC domain-containing protein [Luteolibacter yonseiensis]MBK1814146.1 PPC domain-containing protein [Luteolibacter yonseiensis]
MFKPLFLLLALSTPLPAFSPELHLIEPRGGRRGTEMEIRFLGKRLEETSEILFYEPGLAVANITNKAENESTARLTIAPDAPLGEHSVRVRTAGGISELRSFWVGQFPTVMEAEPNATFDQAQRVEPNTTVQGVAGDEDDDYYVCSLKKGQRLSVEVEAMRLGRLMFDAYVAILDPKKFELATCDDAPLLRNDAFASIIAPEDGDYRIVVHEAAYEGTPDSQYRLHIGTFPRPKAVFPTGGKPGETIEFTFIGDPSGPIKQSITLPAEEAASFPVFPVHDGLSAPSPHWITVSPLEAVNESGINKDPASATPVPPVPCAMHGILDGENKMDWFKFTAKKDQNLVLRVLARSHRSPLDSILSLHQMDGKQIAANDDQGSPDSIINWTCPADGEYCLRVRDQLDRTDGDFTYRMEITEKKPSIAANLPTVERVNSQKWKTFSVPRGNRYAAVVNVVRENIACDSTFEAGQLPAGITMTAPPVPKSITTFPVVFEAAPDAPLAGGLVPFSIKATGDVPLTGGLADTIHHVDVNNQGAYHSVTVNRVATAVIQEAPFKIDLETPAVPIVKNGTLPLKVRATRKEGYAEKITVRFLWNPPGISAPVTLDIPGDQSEILYELNANNDAATGDWQVCVLAEANTPQGTVLVSSALTTLKIAEPFVGMALDLAATEQNKATSMVAKIEQLHPFEGTATVELFGLPHGASCPPQNFTKDQTELTFPVAIAADATVGKHNAVFCRVLIPQNGTTILHQTAMNSTLRIDAPPPAPVAKADAPPAAPEKPADPQAQAEKPLSRLEQLRQRAK